MDRNGAYAYRQTDIMTAEPKKLVLMCYEGAIGSLKQAKRQYEGKDYEAKARSVQRFQDIIGELLCGLDFDKGGQIATNLKSIYDYAVRRVLQADIARDIKGFDEVVGLLEELKETWEQISCGKQEDAEKTDGSSSWQTPTKPDKPNATGTYDHYARV